MREYFLKTERIGFSEWTDADLPQACLLWGDANVTRYICARGQFIDNRLRLEISNLQRFHVQYWPIFELPAGELIGCCGLRPFSAEKNTYELGFHLRKKFWGRGYAFEAAAAVVKYGFSALRADKIYAGHHPQNLNSKKQLVRLGFRYLGDEYYEPTGLYHPSYELNSGD
ncbi:Protein N-acetyltransferase, RimJ/RimL family [Sporobacter termitidis DSM 10068]|uniref:Protein N-acetyltransferase, RimJ/RimL family n=1 Tax=Sporobacter termitidis DSM 10068 TaxID=1123282 RepID=A0A1M5TM66_9FIRM|nr:GNAT family N-acetyltransferase [Sporobacter termitidis]SHH51857.1 Protein N-acetyltransferase, RimJ/RimL family [Sporobacter termitidis DSM 10068]